MMKSRHFLMLFACLFCGPALHAQNQSLASIFTNAHAPQPTVPRRSSVIVLAFHGLSFGDLSCYGQTNFQTPNFDRLASEGMRFTNYRVIGDDLGTAQAAMMFGHSAAVSNQTTLASHLQVLGYRTGLIGEWTLGARPWQQGFDDFVGFVSEQEANNYYSDFVWRYAPGSIYNETNNTRLPWVGREGIYANTGGRKETYIPDLLLDAAARFVRVNEPDAANHYRPFFLVVNLPAPHSASRGQDVYPVPTDAPFSGEKWPQAAKNRAALVTRLDSDVGRLLTQLGNIQMTNNVAIFLTGASAPEKFANTNLNFLKLKNEVQSGDSPEHLRVPMLVHWPAHVPSGRVSDKTWSVPDLAPTIMEIAYAKPSSSFNGVSVLPTLLGNSTNRPPASPANP